MPALDRPDLLASPVAAALAHWKNAVPATEIGVAEIDPELADTAAFCERYGVALSESANCVVVAGRRGGETRLAACVVLATTRADVNGLVRRQLDARKASFAPIDVAVAETGMEYGGITPVGSARRLAGPDRCGSGRRAPGRGRQRGAPVQAGAAWRGTCGLCPARLCSPTSAGERLIGCGARPLTGPLGSLHPVRAP